MAKGYYKCECGKEFSNPQSFNGHKSHCCEHLKAAGKIADLERRISNNKVQLKHSRDVKHHIEQCKKNTQIQKWVAEQHRCEHCGKVMTAKYGSGRFCCRSCANSRVHTEATKKQMAISIRQVEATDTTKNFVVVDGDLCVRGIYEKYMQSPSTCVICGRELSYKQRHRQTCSLYCRNKLDAQKQHANPRPSVRRSKNEVLFCDLCTQTFSNVLNNAVIFDGWDADVILPDLHYAILWNGPWHYRQVVRGQSLKQIQNRDRLKLEAIKKCGYTPYIIKDMGKYNPKFVQEQFDIFLQKINETK